MFVALLETSACVRRFFFLSFCCCQRLEEIYDFRNACQSASATCSVVAIGVQFFAVGSAVKCSVLRICYGGCGTKSLNQIAHVAHMRSTDL